MGSDWLPFGTLGRPHGTRGELHLRLHGGTSSELAPSCPIRLQGANGSSEVTLASVRQVPNGYLVRFDGVTDRDAAAALSGQTVEVPRDVLPPLAEDEFYVEDLVGCEVVASDGRRLGRVLGTFWNGAQDIMTVVAEDGAERLLPVVAEYVLHLDRAARQLVVDPHD
jgi:16S rRNA processing protein RimM